ncbi:hypothetical protein CS0771_09920 [Catellatospora sp. IY07-71]|nr:hypothetical protein CS0771_09920 [Catellatospora sp. IY07-71]
MVGGLGDRQPAGRVCDEGEQAQATVERLGGVHGIKTKSGPRPPDRRRRRHPGRRHVKKVPFLYGKR